MNYANYGSRAVAFIIDSFVVGIIMTLLVFVFGLSAFATNSTGLLLLNLMILTAVAIAAQFIYFFLTMSRQGNHNGQTWGKQLLNIRVVNKDMSTFTAADVFKREVIAKGVIGILSSLLFGFIAILNYLFPLFDKRSQALHDKFFDTFVVQAEGSEPGLLGKSGNSLDDYQPVYGYDQTPAWKK